MLCTLCFSLILAVLTATVTCNPNPIVNGVTAVPLVERDGKTTMRNTGRYPYVVSVRNSNGQCAGVLVKNNLVLTAAHCVSGQKNLKVVAGIVDLHNDLSGQKQVRAVQSVKIHPKYKRLYLSGNAYDIAIITVVQKFTLNVFVNTIKLAKEDHIGMPAFVLGWGSTKTEKYSPFLLRANLKILTAKKCEEELKKKAPNKFGSSMLCAVHFEKKQTVCKGDSGAPLVVQTGKGAGVDVLVGVSSWGVQDQQSNKQTFCDSLYPSVFVKLSKVKPWLKENAIV